MVLQWSYKVIVYKAGGISYSTDPYQTYPCRSSLIWVRTVCPHPYFPPFRLLTVQVLTGVGLFHCMSKEESYVKKLSWALHLSPGGDRNISEKDWHQILAF